MTTNSHPVRFRTISPVLAAVAAVILVAGPARSASSTDDTVADPAGTTNRSCQPTAATTVDDAPVRNVPGRPDGWYEPVPAPTYRPVADGGPRINARYL